MGPAAAWDSGLQNTKGLPTYSRQIRIVVQHVGRIGSFCPSYTTHIPVYTIGRPFICGNCSLQNATFIGNCIVEHSSVGNAW